MTAALFCQPVASYWAILARAAEILDEHRSRCSPAAVCECPSWRQCWQRAEHELEAGR